MLMLRTLKILSVYRFKMGKRVQKVTVQDKWIKGSHRTGSARIVLIKIAEAGLW